MKMYIRFFVTFSFLLSFFFVPPLYSFAALTVTATGNVNDSHLQQPYGIVLVGTEVWITNADNTIARFTTSGASAGNSYSGNGLNSPFGAALIGNEVWVANAGNDTISRFNTDGTSAGSVLSGNNLNTPYGILTVGTEVWITNGGNDTISRFNTNGTSAGSALSGNGLNKPIGIGLIGSEVWVANYIGKTVSRFNTDGTSAGSAFSLSGSTSPTGILVVSTEVWIARQVSISRLQTDRTTAAPDITGNGLSLTFFMAIIDSHVWAVNPSGDSISIFSFTTSSSTDTSSTSSSSSGGSIADAPMCGDTKPTSAPVLYEIDTTDTTATLYFVPAHDPYTYYFVAYGLRAGDIQYGVQFPSSHSTGAIKYTINKLTPQTPYYFQVRAGNGCATGQWSNTLAATTKYFNFFLSGYAANTSSETINQKEFLSPVPTTTLNDSPLSCSTHYIVQKGEFLWEIASRILGKQVKNEPIRQLVDAIREQNNKTYPSLVHSQAIDIGWNLYLPCLN